jgi:hypothetical protein
MALLVLINPLSHFLYEVSHIFATFSCPLIFPNSVIDYSLFPDVFINA